VRFNEKGNEEIEELKTLVLFSNFEFDIFKMVIRDFSLAWGSEWMCTWNKGVEAFDAN
jgi:hypothetical protein